MDSVTSSITFIVFINNEMQCFKWSLKIEYKIIISKLLNNNILDNRLSYRNINI